MQFSKEMSIDILIPDGESLFSLWMINCLSKHKNIRIHVVSKEKWVESRFSWHVKSFTYFAGSEDEDERINFLSSLILDKKIDVILPSHVPDIRMLSKHRDHFENLGLKIVLSSVESLDIANSKWNLAEFLQKHQFPTPKTFLVDKSDTDNINDFPILFKPLSAWNGIGFQLVKTKEELEFLNNSKVNKFIGQEYVNGIDLCVNLICKNGRILAKTIQKGIIPNSDKFKPNMGANFINDDALSEIIEKILAKLSWSGVVNFDVIFDPVRKKYFIIEMNPRFWGSVEASERVGVNFPFLMCLLSLDIDFEQPPYRLEKYISNKGVLKLMKDFILFRNNSIRFNINHSLWYALKDPLPKVFKYSYKMMERIVRQNGNLMLKKSVQKEMS